MANYDTVLETQNALESTLLKKLNDLENQFKAAQPTSTSSNINIEKFYQEFLDFKLQVWTLLSLLRQQIAECSKISDAVEMRYRRKHLLFFGVPEDVSDQKLSEHMLHLFSEKLGMQVMTAGQLKVCHRLGLARKGKCRPVLVGFTDLSVRSNIWKKKTHFKGSSIVVSEFLTRQRQELFVLARKRLGIRNCWTSDGNIIIKLQNGTLRRIYSQEDLELSEDNVKVAGSEKADDSEKPDDPENAAESAQMSDSGSSSVPTAAAEPQRSKRAARTKK